MFLLFLMMGITGLVVMAVPAFVGHAAHGTPAHPLSGHHGHALGAPHTPAATLGTPHAGGHAGHVAVGPSGARTAPIIVADASRRLWFIPSPRTLCSLLALYGGFGNALERAFHLGLPIAAAVAVFPTFLVDRYAVRPLWHVLFRLHAPPSSPLDELIYSEARAVVPFRNGRGLVATVRDGRTIQLMGELSEAARGEQRVNVGDLLRIERVDARRERVTVSRLRESG